MGLTPLFELFAGPLSFRLANRMQRIGWSYSSEKSNPRLPRQTGANRTVGLLKVLLQLAVKEGTISYSIRKLYSIQVDVQKCYMEYNIPRSNAGETLSFIQYLRCIGVSIDNRPTGHLKVY